MIKLTVYYYLGNYCRVDEILCYYCKCILTPYKFMYVFMMFASTFKVLTSLSVAMSLRDCVLGEEDPEDKPGT